MVGSMSFHPMARFIFSVRLWPPKFEKWKIKLGPLGLKAGISSILNIKKYENKNSFKCKKVMFETLVLKQELVLVMWFPVSLFLSEKMISFTILIRSSFANPSNLPSDTVSLTSVHLTWQAILVLWLKMDTLTLTPPWWSSGFWAWTKTILGSKPEAALSMEEDQIGPISECGDTSIWKFSLKWMFSFCKNVRIYQFQKFWFFRFRNFNEFSETGW